MTKGYLKCDANCYCCKFCWDFFVEEAKLERYEAVKMKCPVTWPKFESEDPLRSEFILNNLKGDI